ncbi:conserved exported hypothetical protein [Vibrio crassostreae]|uniref:hypothetical protein n=1 Tax=Vibrio crassostreae TaxID=246167 RepID=UPI000F49DDFC|nr:hypothetical protein [Vibrio crassostreae]ROR15637.1 hypothetical protein EDB36_10590 [Vibrio crassostreae]CAK1758455.1 conserved exported hypothetical protein [Vibrio crassostreae]CAK2265666.1 conserved exported hypothetical protein [Vibrio crassostreae]CAK2282150.1 conserved exported hypothetical protein [Vibrio crassostreae]CAK3081135.1 conserved exported hypothetical protein [Vibrio crassostreae]
MKSIITKIITLASLTISMNVSAASAINALSIESIKATLTSEQIQQSLNQWKESQLKRVESRAQNISDRAPIEARRELVESQIEQEYKQTAKAFGL